MSEKGLIAFNGPMACKVFTGEKMQTRRPIRGKKATSERLDFEGGVLKQSGRMGGCWRVNKVYKSPFGKAGDIRWIREPARVFDCEFEHDAEGPIQIIAEYSDGHKSDWITVPERLKPVAVGKGMSNGCFKESARMRVRILRVWVEKVRDISYLDIMAEGFVGFCDGTSWAQSPRECFGETWDGIYKKRGFGISSNPWVWACEFEVIKAEGCEGGEV